MKRLFFQNRSYRIALVSILAVLALPYSLAASAQAVDPSSRFDSIDADNTPAHLPAGLAGNPRVKLVVVMSNDSVAAVKARAPNKEISDNERDATAARVRSQHDGAVPAIQALGGRVLARFENAINGIKIEASPRDIARIAALPGVVSVLPVRTYEHNNAVSVPFIGAPQVWQGLPSFKGEGVKVAIIDTGIDYTHANFGGPGTIAAYDAAFATSTAAANPALFGPGAPRIKGGIDLVGDAYDANDPASVPVPDANPLDCNGHGSHTAGTAAGSGVLANGSTFNGPYNAAVYTTGKFKIGPGVAPKADLYAVRVFGCTGSTNVVTEAIDWAVQNKMDVISMSLGSNFGVATTSDSLAAQNAVRAGLIVVAASGNAGPAPYITSSPAAGNGVIAAAAMDSTAGFPAARLNLSGGAVITVQDSNGAAFTDGTSLPIIVLRTPAGAVSRGCNEAEYDKTRNGGIDITGKLVVTVRGVCARVFRAGAGQHYGAAAVVLINNGVGYPAYEGNIHGGDPASNPFEAVTIPFFGALAGDTTTLTGPIGGPAPALAVEHTSPILANPGFETVASFSSSGPRYGDSELRAGIAAPGVSVNSTLVGSGSDGIVESGTSMATPHVAGVAALVRQAKKTWSSEDQRSAIVQTAIPGKMKNFLPRLEGAGVVDATSAVGTQVIISGNEEGEDDGGVSSGTQSLSFGLVELQRDFSDSREIKLRNRGNTSATFNVVANKVTGGAGVTVSVDSTVTVGAHDDADLKVTLKVPTAAVPATHPLGTINGYNDVSGSITLTPVSPTMNNGVSLTLPYLLVPRVRSALSGSLNKKLGPAQPSNALTLTNAKGAIAGTPDFYSLGLTVNAPQQVLFADTRAVGVQSNPRTGFPNDRILVFAINTFTHMSNPAPSEFDILIDTTGSGTPNYAVVAANGSAFSSSLASGRMAVAVFNLVTGTGVLRFFADTATDNATILLPVRASDLGLSPAHPSFAYAEQHFSGLDGSSAAMPGSATFNAYTPSLSVSYAGAAIAPKSNAAATVSIDVAEWARTPSLGLMIVGQDNLAGKAQAQLIKVGSTGSSEGED